MSGLRHGVCARKVIGAGSAIVNQSGLLGESQGDPNTMKCPLIVPQMIDCRNIRRRELWIILKGGALMFDVTRFIAQCEAAAATDGGRDIVRQILGAAVSNPADLPAVFGEPKRAGFQVLHRSPSLTIIHVAWPPSHTQVPHNHLMWAEVGVYSGREDHIFWRRCAPDTKRSIEAIGGTSLAAGDCCSLEPDVIHSVTNPLDRVSLGLHVYGGELPFGAPRSRWDGETLLEGPLDLARDDRAVEVYNARFTE
jgi:predicted metal-dependent enzyme (double-stranded beta helix superfamily)